MGREALMVYEKHAEEDEAVKHRLVVNHGFNIGTCRIG